MQSTTNTHAFFSVCANLLQHIILLGFCYIYSKSEKNSSRDSLCNMSMLIEEKSNKNTKYYEEIVQKTCTQCVGLDTECMNNV